MEPTNILVIVLCGVVLIQMGLLRTRSKALNELNIEMASKQKEQDKTRKTLKALRKQFATLVDAAFDALIVLDPKRRIVSINEAARAQYSVELEVVKM